MQAGKRYVYLPGLAFIFFLLIGTHSSMAQGIPIPNPNWPLDSVVNTSVHRYSVQGDPTYKKPSWFVWNVSGGTLFYDTLATQPVLYGTTDTVRGNARNKTTMYVKWELFNGALDTGYVYVYEISHNNCQLPDDYEEKYPGMRIKVSAPPDVWFLYQETNVCAYEDSFYVEIGIDGMPPFDLEYSINSVVYNLHVEHDDLIDSDGDGELNNVLIVRKDFKGTTNDLIYQFELLKASSGGVIGEILDNYYYHSVFVFAQPEAPYILRDFQDVTANVAHNYILQNSGTDPEEWYWELINVNQKKVFEVTTNVPSVTVPFNVAPGDYRMVAFYRSTNACYSLADSMDIRVYDYPTIQFTGVNFAEGCSWSSVIPTDDLVFNVHFEGAPSYNFTCTIYDFNGLPVRLYPFANQTENDVEVRIPNDFVNDLLPEQDRTWKLIITNATNEEKIGVTILDADIDGGRDERDLIIHTKPIITEDIDFAN